MGGCLGRLADATSRFVSGSLLYSWVVMESSLVNGDQALDLCGSSSGCIGLTSAVLLLPWYPWDAFAIGSKINLTLPTVVPRETNC